MRSCERGALYQSASWRRITSPGLRSRVASTPFVEGVRRYIDWLRAPAEEFDARDAADPDPVG